MAVVLLVALGGALGTVARFAVNRQVATWQLEHWARAGAFPVGTVLVNVTGCLVIGFLAALAGGGEGRAWLRSPWRDFLMVGFCGGYTTFSTFGLQTVGLTRDGAWLAAGLNVVVSNVVGIVAVWVGLVLGRWVKERGGGGDAAGVFVGALGVLGGWPPG
jgi:CrcB protein